MIRPLTVMLVAAEASGDRLGAELARALRMRLDGRARFVGVGGEAMTREGIASPFPIAELSILGLVEGLRAYPRVLRRVRDAVALARRERPDVAVLIDSWGFTLRVARGLRRFDPTLPLVKYVGPQVWASRPGRARTLARAVDLLLSTQVMDAPFFEREGLETVFVGNPSLAREVRGDGGRLRARIGAATDDPILLVLPGSRPSEVARMGPPLGAAAASLVSSHPRLHVVVPVAETVAEPVKAMAAGWPTSVRLIDDEEGKEDAMAAATVALACSGSVTTELALAGCPMVVGYRLGPITHFILKRLVTTRYITLFNIAAEAEIAPELIQDDCTGEALAREAALRLDDPVLRARQIAAQCEALAKMGRGATDDPAGAAADAVIDLLRARGKL